MREANATHPNREQLSAFIRGTLGPADQAQVESHVAECATCCDTLRSIPHETLVQRMRPDDTSFGQDETNAGLESETDSDDPTTTKIPAELKDHARYRIVRQLGAGGMGVVYQAEHRLMERPVALKVINRRLVNNQVAIERFHLEVKAAAKLAHRNIVTAYDAEQAGDLHFLVMEFVEGMSLSEWVDRRGRLSALHACNVGMQVAQGLQHASEQGMVHRDIKPQNLMRTAKGTIKILDFGLARLVSEMDSARLTRAGVALGTADYIAPEQVEDSRHVDIRADIYSLGCTLYYLLAGRVPFPTGTLVDKVLAHMNRTPESLAELRPDLPSEVVEIVQRMMAKDRVERFQTPAEVVEALKPFGRPNSKRQESPENRPAANVLPPDPIAPPPAPSPLKDFDPFDIPIELEPARPAPAIDNRPARRHVLPGRKEALIRYGVPIGIVALLVVAIFSFAPSFRRTGEEQQEKRMAGVETRGADAKASSSGESTRATLQQAASALHADDGTQQGEWIDLLGAVDPTRNSVAGTWWRQGRDLSVNSQANARIALPYNAPEQYDFEVSFTRNSGQRSIALMVVSGTGQATFEIDAWDQNLAGFQLIGGSTLLQRAAESSGPKLVNGTMYTAIVQVRRGRMVACLNGEPLAMYEGDGSDLSMLEFWRLPDPRTLGVGAYESATTFHRIRVRAVE